MEIRTIWNATNEQIKMAAYSRWEYTRWFTPAPLPGGLTIVTICRSFSVYEILVHLNAYILGHFSSPHAQRSPLLVTTHSKHN